jgi:Dockerin type I domain
MFSDNGGYWRHEGWGEPAAYNGVVHMVYDQQGASGDAGDVYYIRSTDGGTTFSAPFKLNTDATARPQWQPNLSVSPTGTLLATWYDARDAASCAVGNSAVPCYRMYSRKSNDNGVTWLPDAAFSDVVTPLPAQNDPGIQATYAGDYDYGSAVTTKHVTSWTDGRVAIGGSSQQDAFTDQELVGFAVTSTTPGCGSIISTQPTDYVLNLTDPVNPSTVQATDFTVNGTPANSFLLSNGNQTITFHFNSSPVVTQGAQTMHMAAGAINKQSNGDPNLDFTCTFRWDATLLQVTTTVPAVGGNFAGPGSSMYDVNFNEAVDPASVQTSDLTLSGVPGSVTAVSVINGNTTARFTLNLTSIFSGTLTTSIAAGAITDQFGNPGAAFSGNYNYTGNFCPSFSQNFDAVTVPMLPAGWTATQGVNGGGFPFWVTSNSGTPAPVADSLPNSAFSQDPANLLDNQLETPTLTYNSASAQLTFRQNYDLEQSSSTVAFDVGVLEISINGGAYQDIVAAGGSFVNGGYNHTSISTGFSNPCTVTAPIHTTTGGWSGISNGGSGGFETSTVMLPASGVGMPVKLRWRMCSDNSVTHAGWRVDSIGIYEPCGAPTVVSAVSRKTHGGAGNFDINLPLTGTPGVECRSGGGTNDYSMVVTFTGNVSVTGNPQATVTAGTATIGTGGVPNGGTVTVSGATVTIPLTSVANAQTINVTLHGVNDGMSNGDVVIPMSRLLGDTNANGSVSSTDVSQTKGALGQTTNGSNFRTDVNVNGGISSTDVSQVKSALGTGLP